MSAVAKNLDNLVLRDSAGRIMPGSIQHIGGRRRISPELREYLDCATMPAARKTVAMLEAKAFLCIRNELVEVPNCELQFRAAEAILNRVYGKPMQQVELDLDIVAERPKQFDVSKLTDEELKALEMLKAAQKRMAQEP